LSRLAIIPARGGSKRIPRKNIKLFLGKPIIAYSIEAALTSGLFDKVIVSTDDEEIAKIAKSFGADVPVLRTAKNSDDHATVVDVLIEVVEYYKSIKLDFTEVACLFATAPFVNSTLIQKVHDLLDAETDSTFTIQNFGFPIFRALKKDSEGNVSMFWPENLNTRSQDLPQAFHDAGQLYWIKAQTLLSEKKMYTTKSKGFEINRLDAIDIDTEDDWKTAEALYGLKSGY
jgi:N-acylneuraminate cytidylyltransferase